jgi:hypothetical protein
MLFKFEAGRLAALAALAATLAAACVTGGMGALPVAGPTDLARGAERYPDLTASELASGRSLVVGRCSSCHQTPDPASKSPDAWPAQVAAMTRRAHLNEGQQRAVERYLVTMSMPPQNPSPDHLSQSASGSSR